MTLGPQTYRPTFGKQQKSFVYIEALTTNRKTVNQSKMQSIRCEIASCHTDYNITSDELPETVADDATMPHWAIWSSV